MNPNPRQAFLTRIAALAQMVPGFTLAKEMLGIYEAQLKDLGYEALCIALDEIISTRSSRDPFPSVREIRERLDPKADPETEANLIASQIVGAITRIGPYNSAAARAAIGDVGWEIVRMEGGWEHICQSLTYDNLVAMKAQWRNTAKAFIVRGERISSDRLIEHKSNSSGRLISLEDILKRVQPSDDKERA